ncbi:Smoothelin [Dirofilaria immitis]
MGTSLPKTNTAMGNHDRFHQSITERRIRNRSLCSLLLTPPLYPGYLAKFDKPLKSSFCQPSRKSTISEIAISSNPITPNSTPVDLYPSSIQNSIERMHTFKCEISSQLQASENENINWKDNPKKYTNSKESSGYGSGTSESDLENEQQSKKTLGTIIASTNTITINSANNNMMNDSCNNDIFEQHEAGKVERTTRRLPIRQRQHPLEKSRRRSVPANLRNAFTDEIVHVLEINGILQYETDADTGVRRPIVREQSINRPESVIQLARKFAEASAAQDKRIYVSNQKLLANGQNLTAISATTYSSNGTNSSIQKGGIACLYNDRMSKVNVFKQMDQVRRTNQSQVDRSFNPSSIKNALLRWCQIKLQNYPIEITNFSSCWADGMAFCALIHRFVPDSFDFNSLNPRNRRENLDLAFRIAEKNGIVPLLEVDDMLLMGDRPDWKCIFTYVQSFYKVFKDQP